MSFGEKVEIYENYLEWVYCKLYTDNYLGWIKKYLSHLPNPTHRVINKNHFFSRVWMLNLILLTIYHWDHNCA